ncbi:hypothetical protein WJX77_004178 [Trebouxia sp. C0004]
MWHRCAKKWRDRFVKSLVVSHEKLARFDHGICPACLAICACKKCMNNCSLKVGGGRPFFSEAQQREFVVHTLAMLKPHLDTFKAARSVELKVGNAGKPQELHRQKKSPLAERLLCDGCAAAISDLHRICPACDYALCLK